MVHSIWIGYLKKQFKKYFESCDIKHKNNDFDKHKISSTCIYKYYILKIHSLRHPPFCQLFILFNNWYIANVNQ